MANTFPQTPYDLDTRINSINQLAKTAFDWGKDEDGEALLNMAICLLYDSHEDGEE